jgi:hypothetical protein
MGQLVPSWHRVPWRFRGADVFQRPSARRPVTGASGGRGQRRRPRVLLPRRSRTSRHDSCAGLDTRDHRRSAPALSAARRRTNPAGVKRARLNGHVRRALEGQPKGGRSQAAGARAGRGSDVGGLAPRRANTPPSITMLPGVKSCGRRVSCGDRSRRVSVDRPGAGG